MKQGQTLTDLAAELERQREAKRDFIVPTEQLQVITQDDGTQLIIDMNNPGEMNSSIPFDLSEHAHGQVSNRLGIPKKFYDRMRKTHPDIYDSTVNALLKREPETRMVRTLDGNARAFLSDRYRRLDNADLAEAVLPTLLEAGAHPTSTALTDRKLYLKCIIASIEAEVKQGDIVQAGIIISNSEIGVGAVQVQPMIMRLICTNGMIAADHSMRRHHVGRLEATDETRELFSDSTLEADDQAFFMKVRDIVRAVADETKFSLIVDKLRRSTENEITGKVERAVEELANKATLSEIESSSVLRHLITAGDLSQYGLLNAVTATARDDENLLTYDRATELEAIGGQVLELSQTDWRQIAEAA